MGSFRTLKLYQKAFKKAMMIFEISKSFPKKERYGLTSQIRRSSRSVCSCTGEGYRKRKYVNHFISKLTDADMENSETMVWLDFASACIYIDKPTFNDLNGRCEEVGRLIQYYIEHPEKFC